MNPSEAASGVPLLQLREATVVKNGAPVLDRLSLSIREGEHTAILGPNGAGKSTLIRLIAHQDYPRAPADGTPPLLIFGHRLWNVFELRSLVGIVSGDLQDAILNGTLPGRTRGLDAVLSGFFGSYGVFPHHRLTPAMREQDLMARARFLRTLRRLARHGKTIILVTHHIEEIFPEISRVILLHRGRVMQDGVKAAVLTSPRLSAMYNGPVTVREANGFYTAVIDEGQETLRPRP